MPTAWTDEEYATVAEALLWPLSRTAVLTYGLTPSYFYGRDLDARLQQLTEISKARALELARQVRAIEDKRIAEVMGGAGSCGSDLDIVKVGDITFDRSQSQMRTDSVLGTLRGRLAAVVDYFINPGQGGAASNVGGINAGCIG